MQHPADLLGTWSLDRRLLDRRTGESGSVAGTLEVSRIDSGAFRWFESGAFTWGAVTRPATRLLKLVRIDGEWWCTFADGGLFHPWTPNVDVTHACRADLYRGRIEFPCDGEMHLVWDVTGPAKDHRYDTTFSRLTRP